MTWTDKYNSIFTHKPQLEAGSWWAPSWHMGCPSSSSLPHHRKHRTSGSWEQCEVCAVCPFHFWSINIAVLPLAIEDNKTTANFVVSSDIRLRPAQAVSAISWRSLLNSCIMLHHCHEIIPPVLIQLQCFDQRTDVVPALHPSQHLHLGPRGSKNGNPCTWFPQKARCHVSNWGNIHVFKHANTFSDFEVVWSALATQLQTASTLEMSGVDTLPCMISPQFWTIHQKNPSQGTKTTKAWPIWALHEESLPLHS